MARTTMLQLFLAGWLLSTSIAAAATTTTTTTTTGLVTSPSSSSSSSSSTNNIVYKYAAPCPFNPSIQGYTSLVALNAEIRQHSIKNSYTRGGASLFYERNNNNNAEESSSTSTSTSTTSASSRSSYYYQYILCPHSSLDATAEPLMIPPQTSSSASSSSSSTIQIQITCGNDGWSSDDCEIINGKTQVLLLLDRLSSIREHTVDGVHAQAATGSSSTTSSTISFHGISFVGSQEISIAAISTSSSSATSSSSSASTASLTTRSSRDVFFYDCHWKDSQGAAAIFIAPGHATMTGGGSTTTGTGSTTTNDLAFAFLLDGTTTNNNNQDDDGEDNIFKTRTRQLRTTASRQQLYRTRTNAVLRRLKESSSWVTQFVDESSTSSSAAAAAAAPAEFPSTSTSTSTSTTTTTTTSLTNTRSGGMKISCVHCTFENCGGDDVTKSADDYNSFVLIESHTPEAHVDLQHCRLSDIHGAMVLNMEQGGTLSVNQTVIEECEASVAIIRVHSGSQLQLLDSAVESNRGGMATLAAIQDSDLQVQTSRVYDNVVNVASVVVLDGSQARIEDSCLSIYQYEDTTATPQEIAAATTATVPSMAAIVVDASSTLQEGGNSLTRVETNAWNVLPAQPLSMDCTSTSNRAGGGVDPAAIWKLNDVSCLDEDDNTETTTIMHTAAAACSGTCNGLDLSTSCTRVSRPDDTPYMMWGVGGGDRQSSSSSSSSTRTKATAVGVLVLLALCCFFV